MSEPTEELIERVLNLGSVNPDLLRSIANRLRSQQSCIAELEAFKKLVHDRLDEMGIDKHEGEECRVGARLDDVEFYLETFRYQ